MLTNEEKKRRKKESDARYAKKNRKRLSAYNLEYYHKTNRKEYAKRWYWKNKHRERKRRRNYNHERRIEILGILGGKCVKCGFADWRALHIDHVDGNGKLHRSINNCRNDLKFWKEEIEKGEFRLQILCANCNYIKRHENKELYYGQ